MDRALRRLEALLAIADQEHSLIVSGTGDVIEPEDGILAIGSGGPYALAAARALRSEEHTSELQSRLQLVCRLLLEKKKKSKRRHSSTHSTADYMSSHARHVS